MPQIQKQLDSIEKPDNHRLLGAFPKASAVLMLLAA
jgi:hypothetical protein